MNTINDIASNNYIEICPGCLACYNQGRLTFYWFQINKETTLKQIQKALDIEEIHKKAKTPYACGGDEVHIQDNDFGGGEYMTAEELFGLVQLLQLVPNFDYVRAFKDVFLMGDELDVNHEPTETFKDFADNVTIFNSREDEENALEDMFTEHFDVPEHLEQFINWREVREFMLDRFERAEINGVTYLWSSY
jgi:hypothetical protein